LNLLVMVGWAAALVFIHQYTSWAVFQVNLSSTVLEAWKVDIVTLTAFISPFLPSLMKLGGKAVEKATESAAGKFGEAAFAKAQAIWGNLSPKVEAKEAAKKAAIDVANSPEDEGSQAALRLQLKELLEQDEDLMKAIAQILAEDAPDGTPGTQVVQNVTGNQNQVIGQVTGGKVIGNITGNVTM
jgi:hypothetical protein